MSTSNVIISTYVGRRYITMSNNDVGFRFHFFFNPTDLQGDSQYHIL